VESVVAEPVRHAAEVELALAFEPDEHEAAPAFGGDAVKREVRLVEIGRFHAPRRGDERALQVVGPGVVRADDAVAGEVALFFGAQDGAAVTADVVECPDGAATVAQEHDGLGADADRAPVAGLGDLLFAAGGDPVAVPDGLQFPLVLGGVAVPGRGQARFEALEGLPH
jgi:hypothetical protein